VLSPAVAGAAEVRIPAKEIARALERALVGFTVHLDYDVVDKAGKPLSRSFAALPPGLGGARVALSLPEQVVELGSFGRVVYRVRDLNLERVSVSAGPREYLVRFFFEDAGYELVAAPGALGGAAPNFQLDGACLELRLRPQAQALALERVAVRFLADIRMAELDGVPGGAALLQQLTGYQERLREAIEAQAERALAGPELLAALNAQLRAAAPDGSAHFDGADVVWTGKR
jgi:hypothetical protein